jgi:GNAT superfamily N-acetyltransferase
MMDELEIVTIATHDDEPLLDEFHSGIYWNACPDRQQPVVAWKRALWGGAAPYELTIRIAGRALRDRARREILGGITFERYPRSGCGFVTSMVVAPAARRQRLGRRLQAEAAATLFAVGAPAVFSELDDPRRITEVAIDGPGLATAGRAAERQRGASDGPAYDRWRRIERNQAWGARVLDLRYVQPARAPGLARAHGVCLIAIAGAQPLPPSLPGRLVRDFIAELYAVTEGGAPDPDLVDISDRVPLVELRR